MSTPSADVIAALEAPITRVTRRAEMFESDGVTPFLDDISMVVESGSVTAAYDSEARRTLSVSFHEEVTDKYTGATSIIPIGPDGIWYDKTIKIWRGVEWLDGDGELQSWECPLGTFRIDNVRQRHHPKSVLQINGRDETKLALTSKFGTNAVFPAGTNVRDLIETVALNAGMTRFRLFNSPQATTVEIEAGGNDTRWKFMNDIATAYNLELFMDTDGYLVSRPFHDPAVTAPTFEFAVNDNLASYDKLMNDSEIYNHVVVVGESAEKIPIAGEATNTAGGSPTSIARIGERTKRIDSTLIEDADQARTLAESYLAVAALEAFEIGFGAVVYPFLDVGVVVQFEDPYAASVQPTRFLLTNVTIPLNLGPMTTTGKRLQVLTNPQPIGA